jgi:phosphinothricin acetyltransferase
MKVDIRKMTARDWQTVRLIYEEGIATGNATFETTAPRWTTWSAGHLRACRLVASDGECVVAWAALSPSSGRCVYAGVADVCIYVSGQGRGHGIGRRLFRALVSESERNAIWTLQAGVFLENWQVSRFTSDADSGSSAGKRSSVG